LGFQQKRYQDTFLFAAEKGKPPAAGTDQHEVTILDEPRIVRGSDKEEQAYVKLKSPSQRTKRKPCVQVSVLNIDRGSNTRIRIPS
jgi:hypothetical protein